MIVQGQGVASLIEVLGVYDGWSVAVTDDGQFLNRWANEDGTPPAPGEPDRRYRMTQDFIDGALKLDGPPGER